MTRAGHRWCRNTVSSWYFHTVTRVSYRPGEIQTHPVFHWRFRQKNRKRFRAKGRPRKRLWHMRPGLRPALPHPRDRLRQNASRLSYWVRTFRKQPIAVIQRERVRQKENKIKLCTLTSWFSLIWERERSKNFLSRVRRILKYICIKTIRKFIN